eukprot:CCRYP_004655-RA/>CCRYP_004655-RA protein AED:0.00 eAED:0.00 QI:164/1/1/1/1/1/2/488/859
MINNDERTVAMAHPAFITETTSQEEGVFVAMDLTDRNVLHDYATSEKDVSRTSTPKNDVIDSDVANSANESHHDRGCQDKLSELKGSSCKGANNGIRRNDDGQPNRSTALTAPSSGDNDEVPKESTGYYTIAPNVKVEGLSFLQKLREYRHTPCFMTPLSTLVLLAVLCSSLVSLLLMIPQFTIGLLLGPLVRRQFWLVEFFYRWDVVGWGHIKLMEMVGKRNGGGSKSSSKGGESKSSSNHHSNRGSTPASTHRAHNAKKKLQHLGLLGHSDTLHQRIAVVPGRVYIHPIPQFVDNLCYLIVCLPGSDASVAASMSNSNNMGALPIIGVLIDCGEATRTLAYIECIYELYYEAEYPRCKYYGSQDGEEDRRMGIEIHAILSTHRHHDHTAGVGDLVKYLEEARREISDDIFVSGGCAEDDNKRKSNSVYSSPPAKVIVVGGAVESVPHCNLFVKNQCFVPLPCVSTVDSNGDIPMANDMNSVVSIECIAVPSHTRGSIVYALRNRSAPGTLESAATYSALPLQAHLFTGDAIFSGGGGVPFEADLEYPQDNFVKHPNKLKTKNGSSSFRPGAGGLSMERCFTEVLTRVTTGTPHEEQDVSSREIQSRTLLYPGHEYTTELLMRQFDPKTIPIDGHWTRMAPSVFFATASHFFVSAHKRALPQGQKLLSLPTPLDKEIIVNPNFRSLKRRGEHLVNALRLWHEFGAKNKIPIVEVPPNNLTTVKNYGIPSPFKTLYAEDLDTLVEDLRSGSMTAATAADRLELLQRRVDEKLIGRRPIPNHLPSHKNVYLGILALVVLGSPPSAVTISDALIMDMVAPVDSNDLLLISKKRVSTFWTGIKADLHVINSHLLSFSCILCS